jgi:hypothetical protein
MIDGLRDLSIAKTLIDLGFNPIVCLNDLLNIRWELSPYFWWNSTRISGGSFIILLLVFVFAVAYPASRLVVFAPTATSGAGTVHCFHSAFGFVLPFGGSVILNGGCHY